MDESSAAEGAFASAAEIAAERLRQEKADLQLSNERLNRELEELRERLSFVEELVGPTETQRKKFQLQLTSARDASLRVAHSCIGSIPTRCVGRLDENWLRLKGLTDHECSMLQRGCVSGESGVPCDISLLGDPSFCPYDRETLEPVWDAKGGFLKLSLRDIRDKWGEEVAMEVMRCTIELDRHDASRRLGIELPWLEKENREMEPAEVIAHLGYQLSKFSPCSSGGHGSTGLLGDEDEEGDWGGLPRSEAASPEDVGEGASRAWSMLEAMMSDLGLNPRSAMTTALISGPELPSASHCLDNMRIEEQDDTDDEVVQEALEEEGRAEQQREALDEEDIQQMLHDSASAPLAPAPMQLPTPQSGTQQKTSTSRTMLTPSGAQTPCSGTPVTAAPRGSLSLSSHGTLAMGSSPASAEAQALPSLNIEAEVALPHEVSTNESLFLRLLEEEVSGNMFIPGSPETSRAGSPTSSGSSP